jgi:hypothetical protein
MRAPLIALLLVTAAFTGCIGALDAGDIEEQSEDIENETSESFVPPAPDRDFVGAIDTDHAHQAPELHSNTHGFELAGHENFQGFYPTTYQGGWGEVDVQGDLAAISSADGPLGATLVDISDPSDPEPLSYTTSTGADFDTRITEDGNYLAVGCQASAVFSPTHTVMGDCQEDAVTPHMPGSTENVVSVYNISDPENPEPVAQLATQATHNLWTKTIDGTIYIFTNEVEILEFQPDAPEGERLTKVATVKGTHDVYVHKHPVTEDWLLYTGSPEDGTSMAIYDINDPSTPSPIVQSMDDVVGWHEQTVANSVIDGRVIAIGGGERLSSTGDVGGAERQKLYVIDVTDPANPEKLATWQLPIETQSPYTSYRYSAHNVDITPTGQVISAWYHGGMWAFDVSTEERQENPETLGFYQPHEPYAPSVPPGVAVLDHGAVPLVWGPQWTDEGRVVLGDMYTGVYTLEPEWGLYPEEASAGSAK